MVKTLPVNAGDTRDTVSIPGSGRSFLVGSTLVFLTGKFHGQRPLWATVYGGSKESDMTKQAYKHMHTHPNFMTMHYFLLQFTDSNDRKR